MNFTAEMIDSLRRRIRESMSDWRFTHTAEVEKMAVRIGELYVPDKIHMLRAAALLHDVTKEKTSEEHLEILRSHGEEVTEFDKASPKTLHARTAVLVVKDEYPEFACEELLLAVGRHTTGDYGMTVCDAIVYLADYIDMSRNFPDCVYLRDYFWSKHPESMSESDREKHLWQTLVVSFDMTLKSLIEEGSPISVKTVSARNFALLKLR